MKKVLYLAATALLLVSCGGHEFKSKTWKAIEPEMRLDVALNYSFQGELEGVWGDAPMTPKEVEATQNYINAYLNSVEKVKKVFEDQRFHNPECVLNLRETLNKAEAEGKYTPDSETEGFMNFIPDVFESYWEYKLEFPRYYGIVDGVETYIVDWSFTGSLLLFRTSDGWQWTTEPRYDLDDF